MAKSFASMHVSVTFSNIYIFKYILPGCWLELHKQSIRTKLTLQELSTSVSLLQHLKAVSPLSLIMMVCLSLLSETFGICAQLHNYAISV